MSTLYLITIFSIFAIYVVFILLMKHFKNVNLTNVIFYLATVICYVSLVLIVYFDVGADDWNFRNTLPTANVSPFMFASSFIFFILPKKIRKYFGLLISLLSVGMMISISISCIHNYLIGYKFHSHFLLDYVAHVSFSLWGIYIIRSKQAELKIKDALISGSIIVIVAIIMMIINVIFDTTFFGLNLNGKHTIYNQIIVDNSYLSAFIYFVGLIILLLIGYYFQKLLEKIRD